MFNVERDINQAKAGERQLIYSTITGIKPDLSDVQLMPTRLNQVSGRWSVGRSQVSCGQGLVVSNQWAVGSSQLWSAVRGHWSLVRGQWAVVSEQLWYGQYFVSM